MEIIDIVDENDVVIGKETIKDAHEKKLLHRTAGVFVFRDATKQEMVIQKRSKHMPNCPGQWAQISGHVKTGQAYLDAAKEELHEEMFHEQQLPELVFEKEMKIRKDADGDPEFIIMYSTVYGGEFSLDPKEAEAYAWITLEQLYKELENDKYTDTFKEVMKKYKER